MIESVEKLLDVVQEDLAMHKQWMLQKREVSTLDGLSNLFKQDQETTPNLFRS